MCNESQTQFSPERSEVDENVTKRYSLPYYGAAFLGNVVIISASRRTDIPAYYSDWLLNRLKERIFSALTGGMSCKRSEKRLGKRPGKSATK
ncbi:MAG: DUF1848 domain-containing protein [Treponema sp.]|jgi:hypothetical protein|nr:DUF1848 domain-containing protein [Treponema sp.]